MVAREIQESHKRLHRLLALIRERDHFLLDLHHERIHLSLEVAADGLEAGTEFGEEAVLGLVPLVWGGVGGLAVEGEVFGAGEVGFKG